MVVSKEEPVGKVEEVKKETKAGEPEIKYVEKEIPVQPKVSTGFLNKPKKIYADTSAYETTATNCKTSAACCSATNN
jgi:hypothetical protein